VAKLKIFEFPDLVLTKKANPVARVEKHFQKLSEDMLETMYEAPGIGLAANQVGLLDRIIVLDTEYTSEDPETGTPKNRKPIVLINPEIVYREGSTIFCEGCLSVPEYTAEVKRAKKIKVQYRDLDGLEKLIDADELLAIAIQHEIDHLDGKLFIDRLSPLKKELAKKKLLKERLIREQGSDDLHEWASKNKKKTPII